MIPRDEEATRNTKQETSTTTSTSSTWSGARSKDPRIVRVSRAFGGKDRHSKVCTVRGLRDRRVRLSVPTAIQLYDLQDRLGLSQPSKVVDWLLDAAKHEIDELPPLQFPPGGLIGPGFGVQPMMMMGFQGQAKSKPGETSVVDWESTTNQGDHDQVNDFFGRQNYPFNNNNSSSFVRSTWDDQTSISLGLAANQDDLHSFGFLQPNQVLAYHHQQQQQQQEAGISTTQHYFPNNNNTQFDPNKDSDFRTSSSEQMSNNVRPFQFSMTANLLPSHNNNAVSDEHENKHNDL